MGACLVTSQALTFTAFSKVSFFVGNMIKSSKTLATLLWKVITWDVKYLKSLKIRTFFAVLMITIGIAGFNMFGKKKATGETNYIGFAM